MTILLMLSGCKNEEKIVSEEEKLILIQARKDDDHYIRYTDGSYIYIEDLTNNVREERSLLVGEVSEAFTREAKPARTTYENIEGTSLPNPLSMGLEIEQSIPYTFTSSKDNSFIYLSTVEEAGWTIIGEYSTHDYIDSYAFKENVYTRIIILSDYLKVYYDIDGDKMPDPYTFVN